jgi:hypothetical protein
MQTDFTMPVSWIVLMGAAYCIMRTYESWDYKRCLKRRREQEAAESQ